MIRRLLMLAVLVLLPGVAQAQTTDVGVEWTYVGVPPAEVATFTNPRVLVDDVVQPGTPSCVARGSDTVCTLRIPMPPDAPHTISVVAFQPKAGADVQASMANINPSKAIKPGLKLTVQFTVTAS